jgi:HAE1 family hydrophobic/amphiphilic exporter-1
VGGLCVSQVLTLFITPVVYYYLDKVDSYISGGKKLNEGAALTGLDDAQPVRHAAE